MSPAVPAIRETDAEFLRQVARLEASGIPMREIASTLGIAPGTLTYRLARLGYVSRARIVDQRSGEPLASAVAGIDTDLIESGELASTEAPAPEEVAA